VAAYKGVVRVRGQVRDLDRPWALAGHQKDRFSVDNDPTSAVAPLEFCNPHLRWKKALRIALLRKCQK